MPDIEQRLSQLEAQVSVLLQAANFRQKTGMEWIKEQVAINEANKVIYATQKRLNERLKSVKLKALVEKEGEKELIDNIKRTDILLAEFYAILDEMENTQSAPADNQIESPANGHIKEPILNE